MPRVLITQNLPEDIVAPLRAHAEVVMPDAADTLLPRPEVLALAPTLAGIINQTELRVDRELLDLAPGLRIVANVASGTDNLDLALMGARGVWAANAPDSFGAATADFTLGLILALARRIPAANEFVHSGRWQGIQYGRWDGDLLDGRTLGLVGYGRIGRAVARRARAFGLTVLHAHRARRTLAGHVSLEELLARADYLSVHVPLTAETRGLMDRNRFARMKRGAFFLNLSRGATTVEADLVDALSSGHLAGAALDVFEREPQVHPGLLNRPNVILTPHIGGSARQSRRHARQLAVRNVTEVLQGRPPATPKNHPALPPKSSA